MTTTSAEFRHATGADIPDFDAVHDKAKQAWHAMIRRPSVGFAAPGAAARWAMRAALAVAYRAGYERAAETHNRVIDAITPRPFEPIASGKIHVPPQIPDFTIAYHYGIRHPDGQVSDYKHREAVARQDLAELRASDPSYAGELVRYAVGAPEVID